MPGRGTVGRNPQAWYTRRQKLFFRMISSDAPRLRRETSMSVCNAAGSNVGRYGLLWFIHWSLLFFSVLICFTANQGRDVGTYAHVPKSITKTMWRGRMEWNTPECPHQSMRTQRPSRITSRLPGTPPSNEGIPVYTPFDKPHSIDGSTVGLT